MYISSPPHSRSYVITYGPCKEAASRWTTKITARVYDEAIVYNLTACSCYLFELYFVSVAGMDSESAYDIATTGYQSKRIEY